MTDKEGPSSSSSSHKKRTNWIFFLQCRQYEQNKKKNQDLKWTEKTANNKGPDHVLPYCKFFSFWNKFYHHHHRKWSFLQFYLSDLMVEYVSKELDNNNNNNKAKMNSIQSISVQKNRMENFTLHQKFEFSLLNSLIHFIYHYYLLFFIFIMFILEKSEREIVRKEG